VYLDLISISALFSFGQYVHISPILAALVRDCCPPERGIAADARALILNLHARFTSPRGWVFRPKSLSSLLQATTWEGKQGVLAEAVM